MRTAEARLRRAALRSTTPPSCGSICVSWPAGQASPNNAAMSSHSPANAAHPTKRPTSTPSASVNPDSTNWSRCAAKTTCP
jgi:hypothetical protein